MAKHSLGWIGMGRMGYPMAERLLKAGHSVAIWNRTRAKAEPLAKKGGRIVDHPSELAGTDIVFTMVSTGKDLEQVYFGENGLVAAASGPRPKILVDCSSIGVEQSEAIRARLKQLGCEFVSSPVSGNGKTRQGRQALHGGFGPEGGVRPGAALSRDHRRLRRLLCRRGRARAHLQDRAQRLPRRRDPEPRRDHHSGAKGRRAAPRLPRLHERQRARLDLHQVQEQCAGQSRLDHDLHAGAVAQGPRSRAEGRARSRRRHAGDGGDARGAAEPFRRRDR